MITLKESVIDAIRQSAKLRLAVQTALSVSHTTLYKYLDLNDEKLANLNVLEAIKANYPYKVNDKDLIQTK
jgi:hypothetical protein